MFIKLCSLVELYIQRFRAHGISSILAAHRDIIITNQVNISIPWVGEPQEFTVYTISTESHCALQVVARLQIGSFMFLYFNLG